MKLGAEKWIDFKESGEDIIKDIQTATNGGPQAALVLAGTVRPFQSSIKCTTRHLTLDLHQALPFNQAVMYLRPTGTLVVVGMPGGGAQLTIPIPLIVGKVSPHRTLPTLSMMRL